MTSFAPTPEGRAAAERMMRTHGHTNAFMPPRPGFPGDPEQKARMLEIQKNLPQNLGAGLGSMQANSPQLAQMQGMLQGTPVGGPIGRAQVAQMPAPQNPGGFRGFGNRFRQATQMPTAQTGLGSAPPSFAKQMGAMGGVGTGLQQMFGNKPAGMKKGGAVKKKASGKTYKSGGSVSSASKRADGCAIKGKTKCKIV